MREIVEKYTDSLLRFNDEVKNDERNGYQMRDKESPRCRTLQVLLCFSPLQFWPVLVQPADDADLDTQMGNLDTKKPVDSECMKHI